MSHLKELLNADTHQIVKNTDNEESYWEVFYWDELVGKPLLAEVLRCFWQSDFMQQTMKVRELQRQYYVLQDASLLRLCKAEEKKLDEMIQKAERFLKRQQNPALNKEIPPTQKTIL